MDQEATGIVDDIRALSLELRSLLHDQLSLAGLEVRLAAIGFMKMVVAAAGIGMLLATSWLSLSAALAYGLVQRGLDPSLALLLLTLLNLGTAYLTWIIVVRRNRMLSLPATLRSIDPKAKWAS